jgi:hypothetical protein
VVGREIGLGRVKERRGIWNLKYKTLDGIL